MQKNMVEKLEKIAKDVCTEQGVALYDLELKHATKGLIVLVYVTKVDGVSIDDCRNVSYALSEALDLDDFIEERYFLEVSSPGLERELKLKKHYVSAIGEMAKITFLEEDKSKILIGTIREVNSDFLRLEVADTVENIPFTSIKKARTYFDDKKK